MKVWFISRLEIQIPNNDLQFLQKLLLYEKINWSISQKALNKMGDHLWYLNEEWAALAFFDNNVSVETKQKMCEAMRDRKSTIIKEKRYVTKGTELESFLEKDLSEFVSQKSLTLFEIFNLPSVWE